MIKYLVVGFFIIAITIMGSHGIAGANLLRETTPPPVLAAEYIKKHYDPEDTIIIAGESLRHFQYYLPNFTVIYNYNFNKNKIVEFTLDEKTIIYEGDNIKLSKPYEFHEFKRDRAIYPKHSSVKLYIYEKNLELDQVILVGYGWHNLESWNGAQNRWMENNGTILAYFDANTTAKLDLEVLSYVHPRMLNIYINDQPYKSTKINNTFVPLSISSLNLKEGINTITFNVTEGCEIPRIASGGKNPDPRCLSLAVKNIQLNKDIIMNRENFFVSLNGGWHGLEDWSSTPTRWMDKEAALMIYSNENHTADLSFKARNFYRPRTLEIFVNDLPHIWAEVPSEGFVMVNVPTISLNEGANIVRFHVPEGCERPSDIAELNNADSRCLSMAVQNITMS
jgi:hypothetical protein